VNPDFDRLVDLTDVSPEDEARLRRVHSMLVESGPPQELPAAIGRAPAIPAGKVVALSNRRRRPVATLLIAAAVAAACFGGGYVLANQAHSSKGAIHVVQVRTQGPDHGDHSCSLLGAVRAIRETGVGLERDVIRPGIRPIRFDLAPEVRLLLRQCRP